MSVYLGVSLIIVLSIALVEIRSVNKRVERYKKSVEFYRDQDFVSWAGKL